MPTAGNEHIAAIHAAGETLDPSDLHSSDVMRDAELAVAAATEHSGWQFDEEARLTALLKYGIHDSASEPQFDALTAAAARICDTPASLITFVTADTTQ